MSDEAVYAIEGVMTGVAGGWLLALDKDYPGGAGDTLVLDGTEPPVHLTVLSVLDTGNGDASNVVVSPLPDMHDVRLLTGRSVRQAM